MPIPTGFLDSLRCVDPEEYIAFLRSRTKPRGGHLWIIRNDPRPVDVYCYLWARFGRPNGIQNALRADDSDNLIHWDWTLSCEHGFVLFLGMSFRTEVHLIGSFPFSKQDKAELIAAVKADFGRHGKEMTKVRNSLEKWVEFVNPFQRLRQAIAQLLEEFRSLKLNPKEDAEFHASWVREPADFTARWSEIAARYSTGLGLCFGIRAMLPVMAEAFVNILMFVLMRPQIKSDQRLRDNAFRQPIDVRIKSLSLTCIGFEKDIDYSEPACRAYHSLVNQRNDLLHGNVDIEKLKFNEVYFNGRVPVFAEYHSMWERSLGVQTAAVGLDSLENEVQVINNLIVYLLSCLDPRVRREVVTMLDKSDLGYREETQRLGILFPSFLVDWAPKGGHEDEDST